MDILSRFLRYLFSRTAASPNRLREVLLNFSVNLHKQQLQLQPGGSAVDNVFTSTFAVALALATVHHGSRSETAAQIAEVLNLDEELVDEIRKEFTNLVFGIVDSVPDVKIHIANGVFANENTKPLTDYCELVETVFDGHLKAMNFRGHPDKSRSQINAWMEEKTKYKIADVLRPGDVDPKTSLLLVNGMYLKGLWDSEFKPEYTVRKPFHETPGSTKMVDMMFQRKNYKMAFSKKLDANVLEMPYIEKKMSLVILLPQKVDGLATIEENLSPSNLNNILGRLTEDDDVELFLPKFKLEQCSQLRKPLEAMGVKDLFSDRADLEGVSKATGVKVSEVLHKAVFEIDEEGTVGMFATPIIMMCYGGASFNFNVDHPFMILIRSLDPDVILFIGSVRHL